MRIVNMTPHDVHIVDDGGRVLRTYPHSENTVRVAEEIVPAGCAEDGTPLVHKVLGLPENVPEPCEGTLYIVSQIVKS